MRAAAILTAAVASSFVAGCVRRGPAFVWYPEADVAGAPNPHMFRGAPLCQRCHRRGGGLAAEPVTLCQGCHPPIHANHPVDVPAEVIPAALPLSDGRIVCHTCHDPHDVKGRKAGLRIRAGEICLQCHAKHT